MVAEVVREAGLVPAKVTVPPRSLRGDLRAVKVVWQRELIRFARDRMRIVVALLQPLLFLFVLGTGLSSMVPAGAGGVGCGRSCSRACCRWR
jgi:ABC-2 type transport system permease protein